MFMHEMDISVSYAHSNYICCIMWANIKLVNLSIYLRWSPVEIQAKIHLIFNHQLHSMSEFNFL